jgi:hypothetical protein
VRLHRVRFTTRRLMTVIAVLAVWMGPGREFVRRWVHHTGLASRYAVREEMLKAAITNQLWQLDLLECGRMGVRDETKNAALIESRRNNLRILDDDTAYYAALRRKHQHAASRPWETVPSDRNPGVE